MSRHPIGVVPKTQGKRNIERVSVPEHIEGQFRVGKRRPPSGKDRPLSDLGSGGQDCRQI